MNIKKEIFYADEECDNLVSSLMPDENQSDYLKNVKIEPGCVPFINTNNTESFSETYSTKNLARINLDELSTPTIKHEESIDIKTETHSISDLTYQTYDIQTSLISIKDKSCGELMDLKNDSFNEHPTESMKRHDHSNNNDIESFPGTSSSESLIGMNFNQLSTSIIKYEESIDIKSEVHVISDPTSIKLDLESTDLENHGLNEHLAESQKSHCDVCGKDFLTQQKMKRHRRKVHATIKKHTCDICNKEFVHKYYLKQHIRTVHDNIIDWKCTQCEQIFIARSYLKRHELVVHQKIRDWKCSECEKSFTRKANLQQHERSVHLNIREWKCINCNKFFHSKTNLKKHEREVHLKIRYWECIQCNKSFSLKSNLKRHERAIHLKTRDWKCAYCEKLFNTKYHLKCHENAVHLKIRDSKCRHCDKSFSRKDSLNLHERTVHSNIAN